MTTAYGTLTATREWDRPTSSPSDISYNAYNWSLPSESRPQRVVGCGSRRDRPDSAATELAGKESNESRAEPGRTAQPKARTELGRRLWAVRALVLAESSSLLDWDGIEEEVRDRRGEDVDDDA